MPNNDFNYATICGKLEDTFEYSHTNHDMDFFIGRVSVKRASGVEDNIFIIASEELITDSMDKGTFIHVIGSLRSVSQVGTDGKSHLFIYVFANSICISETCEYINYFYLSARVRNVHPIRETPFGRIITDFTVIISRRRNITIPCIAWENNAYLLQKMKWGDKIVLSGRLQSREYIKDDEPHEIREFSVYTVRKQ